MPSHHIRLCFLPGTDLEICRGEHLQGTHVLRAVLESATLGIVSDLLPTIDMGKQSFAHNPSGMQSKRNLTRRSVGKRRYSSAFRMAVCTRVLRFRVLSNVGEHF